MMAVPSPPPQPPGSGAAPHADVSDANASRPGGKRSGASEAHRNWLTLLPLLGLALAIAALDQATKTWAVTALANRPISLVGDLVELRLNYNSGAAFGILPDATVLLSLIAAGTAVGVAVALFRGRIQGVVARLALALLLGGAVGNLVDRLIRPPGLLRGEVVDLFRVGAWPTFNVADSAITIGAVLFVLVALRTPAEPTPPGPYREGRSQNSDQDVDQ